MKLIEALNAELLARAVDAAVVDIGWLRADTTVVPADIKYPTDSGLLCREISRIGRLVARLHDANIEPRIPFDNQSAARQAAHRIGSRLRRRTEDARAEGLAINAELTEVADTVVEQTKRVSS